MTASILRHRAFHVTSYSPAEGELLPSGRHPSDPRRDHERRVTRPNSLRATLVAQPQLPIRTRCRPAHSSARPRGGTRAPLHFIAPPRSRKTSGPSSEERTTASQYRSGWKPDVRRQPAIAP